MKKRLIGSLLFGALMVSSSSVFVSCADYDDDINANKAEIVAAQQEIAKLTSSLEALKGDLAAQKTALQQEFKAADDALKTKLEEAMAELNAAIAAKADQTTVDNLVQKVDQLTRDLAALQAAYEAKIATLEAAIARIDKELANKVNKSELDAAIATLQNLINNKVDKETFNEAVARITTLEGKFDQLKDLINQVASQKAELSEFNNKVDNINKDIAALKELLNGKVSQEAFNTLEKTVESLSAALEKVQTVLSGKADQSAVDALNADLQAKYKELNDLIRTYVTPEQLNEKLTNAINLLRAELVALINQKANQSDLQSVSSELAALAKTVEALGNSKADNAEVKAQLAALETNLKNLIDTKADKKEVEQSVKELLSQITALQAQTAAIETALATKAEQAYVEAQLASLKAYAEALVQAKADQTEIVRIDAAIKALETAINQKFIDLNTDINQREAALKNDIQFREDALKALIAAVELGIRNDMGAQKAELEKAIEDLKNELNGTIDSKEEALYKALNLAVDNINTTITTEIAAVNKRIDDVIEDLNAARKDIVDILAELASAKGSIKDVESKFDKLIADLVQTDLNLAAEDVELAKKIEALDGLINGHISEYLVAKKELDNQILALQNYDKILDAKDKEIEENLAKASEDLQKQITAEVDARKEAITEVYNQMAVMKKEYNDAIAALTETVGKNAEAAAKATEESNKRIKALEDQFSKLNELIDARVNAHLSNLYTFVNRSLKSISLVPQLFVGGIEAIEFKSLKYMPVQPGTSGYNRLVVNRVAQPDKLIDNGTTYAWYRLNPSTVEEDAIDMGGVKYLAAIAETRAKGDVTPSTKSPVDFVSMSWDHEYKQPGLVKVTLKKNTTFSLNDLNEDGDVVDNVDLKTGTNVNENLTGAVGHGYIVALKVPRKANPEKNIEAADIVSENQLVVENSFSPKIAELVTTVRNADGTWDTSQAKWTSRKLRNWNTCEPAIGARTQKTDYDTHHFVDSLTLWNQFVDKNDLVFYEVVYNKTLNIRDLVTGCKLTRDPDSPEGNPTECGLKDKHAATEEINKDELASYGLEFRFQIAGRDPWQIANNKTVPYNDPDKNKVDNETDQQQFAVIDPIKGIVSAKTPAGVPNNRAVVGKEPIIRIMLIDTKNNNTLVDERYMKIKWVELKKPVLELDEFKSEETLVPCDTTYSKGITWEWFIDQVYAKINQNEKIYGISQKTFEQIYLTDVEPVATFNKNEAKWDNDKPATFLTLLSAPTAIPNTAFPAGDSRQGVPTVGLTTNKEGDALIANWNMHANQIANIYPYQSKVFYAKIKFTSTLPTEYPDVVIPWKFIINLPKLPTINGFYDNYWLNPASKDRLAHDVMGVQYNTRLYRQIKNGEVVPGKGYGIAQTKEASIENHSAMELYDANNNAVEKGTPYFVFYNNLMNAFTYETDKKENPLFIVKSYLEKLNKTKEWECMTWDMQFTWNGPDAILAHGTWNGTKTDAKHKWMNGEWTKLQTNAGTYKDAHNNVTAAPNKIRIPDATKEFAFNGNGGYPQVKIENNQYQPSSNTNSPALSKIDWKTAGAYKLENNNGAQALQMEWWGFKKTPVDPTDEAADAAMYVDIDQENAGHIAWDGVWDYKSAILYADHHNPVNQALLNQLDPKGGLEKDGITPLRTHTKPIHMGIWGTLNDWNIIPVYDYDIYLVEPIRIDVNVNGAFEEGHVSGTAVKCEDAFVATDWRGYKVAKTTKAADAANEYTKYKIQLYKYYEIGDPDWDTKHVTYGMKKEGANIVRDDTGRMTAAQISNYTNGNIVLSIEEKQWPDPKTGELVNYLVFKNNGGSNVEEPIYCWVPVSVTYGFGKVTNEAKIRIYPKGQAFDDEGKKVDILDYPGGDNNSRRR